MKKYLLLATFGFATGNYAAGQVTCIYCYEQNAPVSPGVNNLIQNGGFENGTCAPYPPIVTFCTNSIFYPICAITNWTSTGGGIDTEGSLVDSASLISVIAEGAKAAYFEDGVSAIVCATIPGDTSCLNSSNCAVIGIPSGYPLTDSVYGGAAGLSLEQTVNGLTAGNIYVLEFWAGGRGDTMQFYTGRGLFAVDVGFGNIMLRDNPTLSAPAIGTRYIIVFMAVSSSHTIKFTSWGNICVSCTELVLDDVRLYILAELSPAVPPCTAGLNEFNENTLANIYPNPVADKLNITLANYESSQIILYDIASRKLLQQSFTNSVSLNIMQLKRGIYFYEVRSGNKMMRNGKVVKE